MGNLRLVLLGVLTLAALIAGPIPGGYAATFTVNSTADGGDAIPGNGNCDDAATGCTLRAAIMEANALAGVDTIAFDIAGAGPHTIRPATALPTIAEPVIIDGTSEPDFAGTPIVELSGTNAGGTVDGLTIAAGGSTVRGLVINRFGGDGIEISTAGGNVIEGNFIGTDTGGTADLGNSAMGVHINKAPSNTIGGTTAGARNVISGNDHGIKIFSSESSGNQVLGNYIGSDAAGVANLGNTSFGVYIVQAPSNTVGGMTAAERNVISANHTGVRVYGDQSTGNTVQGNYVGTDATGAVDLGNVANGVHIVEAPSNTVGGGRGWSGQCHSR
jgi:CSLREA domain-containing protein